MRGGRRARVRPRGLPWALGDSARWGPSTLPGPTQCTPSSQEARPRRGGGVRSPCGAATRRASRLRGGGNYGLGARDAFAPAASPGAESGRPPCGRLQTWHRGLGVSRVRPERCVGGGTGQATRNRRPGACFLSSTPRR